MSDRVWSATLDGRWRCLVERIKGTRYSGTLRVFDGSSEVPIMVQPVTLRPAIFGPDALDISRWMDTVADFVDGLAGGR